MPPTKEKKLKLLHEVLALTEKENKARAVVNEVAEGEHFLLTKKDIHPILLRSSSSLVAKASELDPVFDSFCRDLKLVERWNARLAMSRPGCKPIITMDGEAISALDQIKGHHFLQSYFEYVEQYGYDSPKAMILLKLACKYKIFEALQWYCSILRERLLDSKHLLKNIRKSINMANEIARCHWSIGYTIACKLYISIGRAYFKAHPDFLAPAKVAILSALECLYLAEYLNDNPYSQAALENAGEAGKHFFLEMRKQYKTLSDARCKIIYQHGLNQSDLQQAKLSAQNQFKNIKLKQPIIENQVEDMPSLKS